jgi:hypothetical protein
MKKLLVIISIIGMFTGLYAVMPVGVELGAGYAITTQEGSSDFFFLESSALVHIYENFYARAGVVNLSFVSGETYINLGTGVPIGLMCGSGLDLMMFFNSQKTIPYALAGLSLTTGGGHTTTNFRAGGGVEYMLGEDASMRPFAELTIDINNVSNATSSTSNVISLKGGLRLK